MTKREFLTQYALELQVRYDWAREAARLERFMASVTESLTGDRKTWNHEGDAVTAAWRRIGGKGKPTFKALHALP